MLTPFVPHRTGNNLCTTKETWTQASHCANFTEHHCVVMLILICSTGVMMLRTISLRNAKPLRKTCRVLVYLSLLKMTLAVGSPALQPFAPSVMQTGVEWSQIFQTARSQAIQSRSKPSQEDPAYDSPFSPPLNFSWIDQTSLVTAQMLKTLQPYLKVSMDMRTPSTTSSLC
jgi:hypothetical protein